MKMFANLKQCTAIVPEQYGCHQHKCAFHALPGDTLCGTHRRGETHKQLRAAREVKVPELVTVILDLCGQLPVDNGVRNCALDYLQRKGLSGKITSATTSAAVSVPISAADAAAYHGDIDGDFNY